MRLGYTVKEIAAAVEVTERAIQKQSQKWNGVKRPSGKGFLYPLEALPEKIQQKLRSIYDVAIDGTNDLCLDDVDTGCSPDDWLAAVGDSNPSEQPIAAKPVETAIAPSIPTEIVPTSAPRRVSRNREAKTDAWIAILKARDTYCLQKGLNQVVDCDTTFAKAYQLKEIDLPEDVYQAVTLISRSTVARKRAALSKGNGLSALGGKENTGRPK